MKYSYSYSRLNNYAKCPLYFKFRHIDDLPIEQVPILVVGNVIHDALGAYTMECYKNKVTNLYDQWEAITLKALRDYVILPEYEDEIKEAVKAYVEANEVELEGLIGVEEEIAIDENYKLVPWDNGWFRAILDKLYIVGNTCAIRDYKTGYSLNPDKFQLEVYVWVVSKVYPEVEHFEVELDFTRFAWKKTWNIDKSQLPMIERKILNRIQQIEDDTEFKPKVSSHCQNCPYWQKCPAMKDQEFIKCPKTIDEAKTLVEQVIRRQIELKAIKDALKTFVQDAGTVEFNDMCAKIKPITSYSYDVPRLVDWANKGGYQILDALNVDSRKIKKVIPKTVSIPGDLITTSMGTRFEVKKIKEDKEIRLAKDETNE